MYNTRYQHSIDSAASSEDDISVPKTGTCDNASATTNALLLTPQRVSTRDSSRPPVKQRRTGKGPDTMANEVAHGPSAAASRQEPVDPPSNIRPPASVAVIPRMPMHVEFASPIAHVRYFHTSHCDTPMVDQDRVLAEGSGSHMNEEESSPILHMRALRKPAETEIESHFIMKQAEHDMHRQIQEILADADCEDTSEDESIILDSATQRLQQERAEKYSELENSVRSYQKMLKGPHATDAILSMQKSFLRSIGTAFDEGLSSQCDKQAREIGRQREEIILLRSKLDVSGTYEDLFHEEIQRVSELQDCNDQLKQAAVQSLDEINIARKEAEDHAKLGRLQARRLVRLEEDLKFHADQAHQLRTSSIPSWCSVEDDLQHSHELLRAEQRRHIESRAKSQDVIAGLNEKLRRVQGNSSQQLGGLERQLHESKQYNITLVNELIETKRTLTRNEMHDSSTQADRIITPTANMATSTSEHETVVRKDAGNLTSAEDFSRDASTAASLSCTSCNRLQKQIQEVRFENSRYRGRIEEQRRSFQRLEGRCLMFQKELSKSFEEKDQIQSHLETSEKTISLLRAQLLFSRWYVHYCRQRSQTWVETLLRQRFNDITMIFCLLIVIVIFNAQNSRLSNTLQHACANSRTYQKKYIIRKWQSIGHAGRNLRTRASLQASIDQNKKLNATNAGLAQEVDNLHRNERSLIAKTALQMWKYAAIQGKQARLQIRLKSYASTNFYLIIKARMLRREKDEALLDLNARRRLVWRYAITSQQKQKLQVLLDQSRARGLRNLVQVASQLYHKERECANISVKLHNNRMASLRLVYNVFLVRQKNFDLRDRIGISIARGVVEAHQQNQQSGQLRLRRILKAGLLLRKLTASNSALESVQTKYSTLVTRVESLGLSNEQLAPISDTGRLGLTTPPFRQVANAVVDVGDYSGTTSLLLGFGSSISSRDVLIVKCRCHDENPTTLMCLIFDNTSDSVHMALCGKGWGSWAFCQEIGAILANSKLRGFLWRIKIPFENTILEWTLDKEYTMRFKEWRRVLENIHTP